MNFFLKVSEALSVFFIFLQTLIYFKFLSFEEFLTTSTFTAKKKSNLKKIKYGCNCLRKYCNFFGIKSCLLRSVAYKKLLNSHGVKASIMIGVDNDNTSNVFSHSWVVSSIANFGEPSNKMNIIRVIE